jgi:pimeloyl-ACP methyl ester carboxylesterase
MDFRAGWFEAPQVSLHYAEAPLDGPPLVMLHGGGGRWVYLRELGELLAADGWHVYLPDLRGHGQSGRVAGAYQLRDYVGDIAAFLGRGVGEPPVLFGHSLGGEIAVMLSAQHPRLVRALVVGDAPLSVDQHVTEEPTHRANNVLWHSLAGRPVDEIEAALRQMPLQVPGSDAARPAEEVMGARHEWFGTHARTLHELDPDMLATVLAGPAVMLAGYEPEVLLPRITCPVLLLQADPLGPLMGGVMTDDDVSLGLRLLKHAQHVRVKGVGHPLNDTQRVLQAMAPFLDTLRARA